MSAIKRLLERIRAKKAMMANYEDEQHIKENFANKQTSHYERELYDYNEEERQKRVKSAVKKIRLQKDRKFNSGQVGNLSKTPNVINGHKKLFESKNMFSKMPNVCKTQNIIKSQKKLFVK